MKKEESPGVMAWEIYKIYRLDILPYSLIYLELTLSCERCAIHFLNK